MITRQENAVPWAQPRLSVQAWEMFWTGQVSQVNLEKDNYQQAAGIAIISRTVLFWHIWMLGGVLMKCRKCASRGDPFQLSHLCDHIHLCSFPERIGSSAVSPKGTSSFHSFRP